MRSLFFQGLSVSLVSTVLACGGTPTSSIDDAAGMPSPAPSEPAGGGSVAAPPLPPLKAPDPIVEQPSAPEARRILALVAPKHLGELDRLVGRYARGDAPIFEGTFDARDNMGSLGPTYKDGVMADAHVNASLAWEEKIYMAGQHVAGWALDVRSPTHSIRISQAPGTAGQTTLSLVVPNQTSGGLTGTCNGCVSALTPTAASFTITDALAQGKWGDGRLLEVAASGSLTRVPLAQVTFERLLAVVNPYFDLPTMKEFSIVGGDRVRTVKGSHSETTPVPDGKEFHSCERVTSYALDWFVDANDLLRYGVRGMKLSSAQTCCNEGPPGACMPRTCF